MNRQRGDDMGKALAGAAIGFFIGACCSFFAFLFIVDTVCGPSSLSDPSIGAYLVICFSPVAALVGAIMGVVIGVIVCERAEKWPERRWQ